MVYYHPKIAWPGGEPSQDHFLSWNSTEILDIVQNNFGDNFNMLGKCFRGVWSRISKLCSFNPSSILPVFSRNKQVLDFFDLSQVGKIRFGMFLLVISQKKSFRKPPS